jgi:hypothetical protein
MGIPQERIASCLGILQQTISKHLEHLAMSPNALNADLKRGFTVAQVAEKHGWPEPLVWSIALEGQEDLKRCKALNWGLRTWDLWFLIARDRLFTASTSCMFYLLTHNNVMCIELCFESEFLSFSNLST